MIKCVIFDCDGTLVDSEWIGSIGLTLILKNYDIQVSADEIMLRFRGMRMVEILEILSTTHNVVFKKDIDQVYRQLVAKLLKEELQPFAGVSESLAKLHLPKCVASNALKEQTIISLEATGLRKFFNQNIFSAYQINAWKPKPDIFLHAAKQMGFTASECIVVEDSPVGIAAANTAGMKSVLFDPQDCFKELDSSYRIKNMTELEAILLLE